MNEVIMTTEERKAVYDEVSRDVSNAADAFARGLGDWEAMSKDERAFYLSLVDMSSRLRYADIH